MKKNTRRALTLLLALVLCLGLLPTAALAATTSVINYPGEEIITVNPNAPKPPEYPSGTYIINDHTGEEDPESEPLAGPFSITFWAGEGRFSDGSDSKTLPTVEGPDKGYMCRVQFPNEAPVREGYVFEGWYFPADTNFQKPLSDPEYVTAGTTLSAKWTPKEDENDATGSIVFDANGGAFDDGVEAQISLIYDKPDSKNQLPVPFPSESPTRAGYTFTGWYADEAGTRPAPKYAVSGTTFYAGWKKDAPASTAIRVDFIPNGGSIVSIRGLAAKDIVAGSMKAQENNVFVDRNSGIGMMMTGGDGRLDSFPEIEREGCVLEGWYIVDSSIVNDAYAGKEIAIPSGAKKADLTTVFKSSAYLAAKWGKANPDGPFTVKFDLGYKDPPKDQIPKDQTVKKGGTVVLPDGKKLVCPNDFYEFYAWCMRAEDGRLYPWKESTAVTEDMTLYAGWIKKGLVLKDGEPLPDHYTEVSPDPSKDSGPTLAFKDVKPDSPFAEPIKWAVVRKITNGTSDTTFSPGTTCTRGHILTFLWRSQGSPEPTIQNPYQDEIPNAFQKAAIWAHEKGLVTGKTFGSSTPCTRAASVTYMWKLAGSPAAKTASFKDVSASSDYAKAVSWAVEQGVTKGTGDGTVFSPEATCTRGQIVTFLHRAYAK